MALIQVPAVSITLKATTTAGLDELVNLNGGFLLMTPELLNAIRDQDVEEFGI